MCKHPHNQVQVCGKLVLQLGLHEWCGKTLFIFHATQNHSNNSTKVKHLVSWCYKRLLDVNVVQNQMIGLHNNGSSKITTWLFYMVILNKEVAKSNFNSSKRVEIITCSIFGSMNFSKQNWALSKAKWSWKRVNVQFNVSTLA